MEDLLNKEVIDFAEKSMEEINSELDMNYCNQHNIVFTNNELDTSKLELFSREATDEAYKVLYPDFEKNE
ncbi:hypothetical protein KCTC32516_00534 [Polaribacter huanghezhanensis]|uniref:hypothetical protein n=1 Tax=Polaribacter huanghezhanensis TaxID=1354726 RepID=UPI00264751A6|nr:hypothetical protein [Polaribacter huanghezhanensis]WKD85194.1 hypothetical protein KCTC32516_00534 [Polaribacter huanghezhanensis]